MDNKTATIIGARPAAFTAGLDVPDKASVPPMVCEMDDIVDRTSRAADYEGNEADIGGHRLFSRSLRVVRWRLKFKLLLPVWWLCSQAAKAGMVWVASVDLVPGDSSVSSEVNS